VTILDEWGWSVQPYPSQIFRILRVKKFIQLNAIYNKNSVNNIMGSDWMSRTWSVLAVGQTMMTRLIEDMKYFTTKSNYC
jgi:hypothetical protein